MVVDCMYNTLKGNAQDHFHQILVLMKESAESNPVPPAFESNSQKLIPEILPSLVI